MASRAAHFKGRSTHAPVQCLGRLQDAFAPNKDFGDPGSTATGASTAQHSRCHAPALWNLGYRPQPAPCATLAPSIDGGSMNTRGTAQRKPIDLISRGVDLGQIHREWYRCEPVITSRLDLHQSCAAAFAYSAISGIAASSAERDVRFSRRRSLSCHAARRA